MYKNRRFLIYFLVKRKKNRTFATKLCILFLQTII